MPRTTQRALIHSAITYGMDTVRSFHLELGGKILLAHFYCGQFSRHEYHSLNSRHLLSHPETPVHCQFRDQRRRLLCLNHKYCILPVVYLRLTARNTCLPANSGARKSCLAYCTPTRINQSLQLRAVHDPEN